MCDTLNVIAGTSLPEIEIYRSKGFISHLIKRNHFDCIKHIDDIPTIIKNPDYVGVNPSENGNTIELVKRFHKTILIGIKFDNKEGYLYVSTMYVLQEQKLFRRLKSGRLKEYTY
jgi:hypothetical protein